MLRIPAGGKGIGGILGDDVHPGLGQPGLDGKSLHHLMQVRGLILGNFPGAAHGQGDLVAEPVSHEVHDQGHEEGEVKPLPPRQRLTDYQ